MRLFGQALVLGSLLSLFPLTDLAMVLIALPVIGLVLDGMIGTSSSTAPEASR